MAEALGRLQVEYFDGTNWIAFTSSGNSLVLELEITDTLYDPQVARFKVADLKDNGIFAASSTNSVLKEFMNIRILDAAKHIIYFSGKIFRLSKKYEVPYGETIEVICYDALYSLGNEYLDSDADSIAASKAHTLISTWIGNHISTSLLSVTNDSGDVDRFEVSAYNRANTSKVVKAGRSQISVLSAILQEALQDQRLTALDRGYVYYVDPNFTSTATTHNPAGFFTYFSRNRMPANGDGTSGDATPLSNGLTIERPSGATISETGQKHLMQSSLDISSSSREMVTDIIASYYHEDTGKRVSKRFSIIHYTAISGMAAAQYSGIGFDATVGTGSTNISNLVDSGNNVIGRIQYMSTTFSADSIPGFMILSDRTSHALVAGETLSADAHGSGASLTLSSVATIGSQFVYEPKVVWGVSKTTKSNFNKESDADEIRTKLAGIFEGRQNVPDRLAFTTSQLPYYWAEGRATSSTSGATLHDSAVNWETKGVRTGASFLKLSGTGGTVAAYGYVSSLTDAGVITCTLNTGTWAVNDYYRWQVRVRAGHQVYVKCVPKGISGENQLVTSVKIQQNMGSQTLISWETQGIAARSIPTNLAETISSTASHSAVDVGASAPVPIGDCPAKLTSVFTVGAKSSPDGTRHNTVTWTAGTLKINKSLTIDGNEVDEYTINNNDTTSSVGVGRGSAEALTAPATGAAGTEYTLYFDPDTDTNDFLIAETTDYQSVDRSRLKIARIVPVASTGNIGGDANSESECLFELQSTIILEGAATGEAGASMKLGEDYFAVNGIQAKHMLTIGSDATAGVRFKFWTPASSPATTSSTTWFRGFTGASVSDTTGKWFEFDVANKAFNLYSGAESSKLLAQFTGSALTFFDGSSTGVVLADKLSEFTTTGLSFFNNSNGYKLSMFNGSGAHIYDGTTATPGSANELVTLNAGGLELHDFATNDQGAGATLEFFAGATESMGKLFAYQTGYGGIDELHLTTATRGASNNNIGYNFVVGAQAANKVSYIKPLWDGFAYLGDPDNNERFKQLGVKEGIYIFGQAPSTPSFGGTTTQYMLYQNSGELYWNGDPIGLSNVATSSGSVPTASYGTFRYDTDGGGGTADVLAFASGQTNATPAAATQQSSFWTMLSEGDASSNRLIFEPITTWSNASGFDNYSYIGWHNYVFSISSYYHYAGDGNAAFPSFAFSNDGNTGFYSIASGRVGFSGDGTKHVEFGAGNLGGHSSSFLNTGASEFDAAIYYDGYVTGSTAHALSLNASTNQVLRASSSIRYKKEVRDIGELIPTNTVWDLQPKAFKWKEGTGTPNEQDAGLIAEEVYKINPYLAVVNEEGQPEAVRYSYIPLLLLEEMKKLRTRIKQLEEKN